MKSVNQRIMFPLHILVTRHFFLFFFSILTASFLNSHLKLGFLLLLVLDVANYNLYIIVLTLLASISSLLSICRKFETLVFGMAYWKLNHFLGLTVYLHFVIGIYFSVDLLVQVIVDSLACFPLMLSLPKFFHGKTLICLILLFLVCKL